MRRGYVRHHLLGQAGGGGVAEQVRDRGEGRRRGVGDAAAERVAVEGHVADPLHRIQEGAQAVHPGGPGERRPGQRDLRHGRPPTSEIVGEAVQVVVAGAGEHDSSPPVAVPGELAVEVGLVADLECGEVRSTDPLNDGPGLLGRERRSAGGQVDPHDQLGPRRGGQRARRPQPPGGEPVGDSAWRNHAADRPPGLIGAVSADPQDRRLAGVERPDQLHQHGIDGGRVTPGVDVQGPGLEREPQETRGHRRPRGGPGDLRGDHGHLAARLISRARLRREYAEEKREGRNDADAPSATVHGLIVPHGDRVRAAP